MLWLKRNSKIVIQKDDFCDKFAFFYKTQKFFKEESKCQTDNKRVIPNSKSLKKSQYILSTHIHTVSFIVIIISSKVILEPPVNV